MMAIVRYDLATRKVVTHAASLFRIGRNSIPKLTLSKQLRSQTDAVRSNSVRSRDHGPSGMPRRRNNAAACAFQ
jgi:hypothetical protein